MLDDVLELMAKREEINNTREWIETLAIEKTASIQEQALASLVERGTLRREEKRLFQETIEHLWIFRSPRYFLTEGELTEGELTEGELTEGELTEGELTEGERTDAERTDAERTDAERTDAERTDAERTDGKRTRAVPTDREPTEAEPGHTHEQRIVERVLRLQRGDDPAHRDIHGIEHPELSGVWQVTVPLNVLLRRAMGSVDGAERHVQEERTPAVVAINQLHRIVGQEKRRIAALDHRTTVPMPIQDHVPTECEGIDPRRIEAVVMVESPL